MVKGEPVLQQELWSEFQGKLQNRIPLKTVQDQIQIVTPYPLIDDALD